MNLLAAMARKTPEDDSGRTASLEKTFRELGVSNSSFGYLGIKRHGPEAMDACTFRTRLSSKSDNTSFETAFERNRQCSRLAAIPELRLQLAPALTIATTHRVEQSTLIPCEIRMEADWPFGHGLKTDPWLLPLITRFNGSRTVAKIYAKARADGAIPANFKLDDFAALVAMMMKHGYLAVKEP